MSKGKVTGIIIAAMVVLFAVGLFQLFSLGMETGDNFPPYSTLRSDPIGTRALYGALNAIPGVKATRNLESLWATGSGPLAEGGKNSTLIFPGAVMSPDPEDLIVALENFMAEGGRIVITFYPTTGTDEDSLLHYIREGIKEGKEGKEEKKEVEEDGEEPIDSSKGDEIEAEKTPEKDAGETDSVSDGDDADSKKKGDDDEDTHKIKFVSIDERWGFKSEYTVLNTEDDEFSGVSATRQAGPDELPATLSWHSSLHFDELHEGWSTVYAIDGRAVVIERQWGMGSVVLCSDSFFLSNEALMENRRTGLLTWLIGPNTKVVFDETHFGVEMRHGIMTLIRKYRLDGLLIALIIVAALFIWKNATSLTPKVDEVAVAAVEHGKDSTEGLINLLRRSTPAGKILTVCAVEWKKSFSKDPRITGRKQKMIDDVLRREKSMPMRQGNTVRAYREISEILAGRK